MDGVTVPLLVEANRPFIEMKLTGPDGSSRSAPFLVDTGGGFLLAEPHARELGLRWRETFRDQGKVLARAVEPPIADVADFRLDLDPSRVFVAVGSDNLLPPVAGARADGLFPGHLLEAAGLSENRDPSRGRDARLPARHRSLLHDRVRITAGGVGTRASRLAKTRWSGRRCGNLGGQTLETMSVPRARWATHELIDVGVVLQRAGTFERYMSAMTTAPIVGSLGGNVLGPSASSWITGARSSTSHADPGPTEHWSAKGG